MVRNFLPERGDKPEKGSLMYKWGRGLPLFYYFTVQSRLLCVGGSKVSFINFRIFSLLS